MLIIFRSVGKATIAVVRSADSDRSAQIVVKRGQLELGLGAELPFRATIPSSFAIADLASFAVIEASVSSTAIGPCLAAGRRRIQVTTAARDSLSCT